MASIANGLIEYIKTDNGIHAIASSAYGICDDLASTQIKTVNIPGFKLEEGVTIHVKFENGNTAANPKLNINNHENENIDIESVSGVSIDTLEPGVMLTLTYDGTAWVKDYGGTGSGGNISEYDSDDETPSTDDGSLTWISRITQNTDGSITTERTSVPYSDYDNTEDPTGASVPSLDNTSTNFVTERYIYYGLPNINDDHSYNSNTTIYVPLNSGVAGQLLVSAGSSEPQWSLTAFLQNIPSAENEVPSYTHLILGGDDENSNHFAGKIELYSAESGTHSILGQDTVENREHIFPDNDGYVVQSSGLYAGNEYVPVYLDNGELTESFPVQKYEFTIANGQASTIITHFAFNAHTYITEIVVDQGIENLNGPINWTSVDANTENNETFGHIELTTTIATSGAVSGYFIIAHGDLLAPLPSI